MAKIVHDNSYYSWLALKNRLPYTFSTLSVMKRGDLKKLVENMDTNETFKEYQKILAESRWNTLTTAKLREELKRRGVRYSYPNRSLAILALETTITQPEPELDDDQKSFLDATEKQILLYAGPGAGKTTTICAYAAKSIKATPEQRILFLVYTKAAQISIGQKLKKLDSFPRGKSLNSMKKKIDEPDVCGIFSLTLNEYAAKICRRAGVLNDLFDSDGEDDTNVPVQANPVTYDEQIRHAGTRALQKWENWDLVIVDEVQDILPKQETLLNRIAAHAKRVIYAGDIRQQIYSGARFMTAIWNNTNFTKYKLRYNHRSAPEIVKVLNIFSRTHFGNQHIEQVATSSKAGIVEGVIHKEYTIIGEKSAELCCATPNYHAYCISPVSVQKYFGTAKIVSSFRQSMRDQAGPITKVLAENIDSGKYTDDDIAVYVGTSRKLKGTEKNRVIVIQGDVPYDTININRNELTRLMYVALSRARTHLSIMLTKYIRNDSVLACLAKDLKIRVETKSTSKRKQFRLSHISVWEDMRAWELNRLPCIIDWQEQALPLIEINSAWAPDFLGVLMENLLADKMGAPLPVRIDFRETKNPLLENYHEWVTRTEDKLQKDLVLVISGPKNRLSCIRNAISLQQNSNVYNLVQCKFSVLAGKLWTLGEDLKDLNFAGLDKYVNTLKKYDPHDVASSVRHDVPLYGHRGRFANPVAWLTGITDIETATQVIEVKHAEVTDGHTQQVIVYAALCGKQPVLVNTKLGRIQLGQKVTDENRAYLLNFARAKYAAKVAAGLHATLKGLNLALEKLDLVLVADVKSFIDEFKKTHLTEIGAVLCSVADGEVVDVFHSLSSAVTPAESGKKYKAPSDARPDLLAKCGFAKINQATMCTAGIELLNKYKNWTKSLSNYRFAYWGGSVPKLLGHTNGLDIHKIYMAWLEVSGQQRKNDTGILSAVDHIFYEDFFVQHRAFEDAVATASILIALNDTYGDTPKEKTS